MTEKMTYDIMSVSERNKFTYSASGELKCSQFQQLNH